MLSTEYIFFIIMALVVVGFAVFVLFYFGGVKEAANILPAISRTFSIG